jgi:hypothetical protein
MGVHGQGHSKLTDYRLAPSKWGAREEPASAPWARTEETISSENDDTDPFESVQAIECKQRNFSLKKKYR